MPIIQLQTRIKAPIQICFDLSRSIDLHKISTSKTNEEAIAGVTTGLISLGETVTWEAKHFRITQNLTSKITAYDPPFYFRDEQVKGIFKSIIHDHYFGHDGEAVMMKDSFTFKSPYGVLGRLFNKLVLTNYLTKLLIHRNGVIKEFAENGNWRLILKPDQPS